MANLMTYGADYFTVKSRKHSNTNIYYSENESHWEKEYKQFLTRLNYKATENNGKLISFAKHANQLCETELKRIGLTIDELNSFMFNEGRYIEQILMFLIPRIDQIVVDAAQNPDTIIKLFSSKNNSLGKLEKEFNFQRMFGDASTRDQTLKWIQLFVHNNNLANAPKWQIDELLAPLMVELAKLSKTSSSDTNNPLIAQVKQNVIQSLGTVLYKANSSIGVAGKMQKTDSATVSSLGTINYSVKYYNLKPYEDPIGRLLITNTWGINIQSTTNVYNFFNNWINENLDETLKNIPRDNVAITNYILNTLYFHYWGLNVNEIFQVQEEVGNAFRGYAPIFLMFTAFHGDYYNSLNKLLQSTRQHSIPGVLYISKSGFIKMGDLILSIIQEGKKSGAWLAFHINNRKSAINTIDDVHNGEYRGDITTTSNVPEANVLSRGTIWNQRSPVVIKLRLKDFVLKNA